MQRVAMMELEVEVKSRRRKCVDQRLPHARAGNFGAMRVRGLNESALDQIRVVEVKAAN